ncbi:hypothetical protein B0H66DRAFT_606311 [Apodospora peruviana]|uniref:Uncharacterized protein n=1 Tax=Apodospora peruviana TaxID=516989 RepID=A0AAE0HYS1_9PEZI|nr:hypothetical protein B0H66DRAFT_606311 [Apodospora peruviana]
MNLKLERIHHQGDDLKPTQIYIDVFPVVPLSLMVCDLGKGCGDGSQMTSYCCFCTDYYSKFSWDISTAVVGNCGPDHAAHATSAVNVFHNYCTYGSPAVDTCCQYCQYCWSHGRYC